MSTLRVYVPGIGGSLGECVVCGKSFAFEVLAGLPVGGMRVTGIDANLPVHEKCADLAEKLPDGDWTKLPDGPLKAVFAKAAEQP